MMGQLGSEWPQNLSPAAVTVSGPQCARGLRAYKPSPGPYAAALAAILFLGGWSYLQALDMLLAHHKNRADNAPRVPK